MKIISEAKGTVARLWPAPKKNPDQRYRLMRYLLRSECEDGTLLYNVVTSEMVLLENSFDIDAHLPGPYDPVLDELIEKHFAVPEEYDEKKSVDQLRAIVRKLNHKKNITGYTIYPTTCCNARCSYCFESEFNKSTMTEQTADEVVKYIVNHCDGKSIEITWFGGEPLVGRHIINYICNKLIENKIGYVSTMVSNAYLFDENVVKTAVDLWKLKSIQITLDGTEEVYNKTKAYINVQGSPYQRVLRNIDLLLAAGVSVAVRLNVTDENGDDLSNLIDELKSKYTIGCGLQVYTHPVYDKVGYNPTVYTDESKADVFDTSEKLQEKLVRDKLSYGAYKFPHFKETQCMADNDVCVTIFPDGRIGKCENSSADEAVASIFGDEYPERLALCKKYIDYEYCDHCSLYPDCLNLAVCPEHGQCNAKKAAYKIKKFTELLSDHYQISEEQRNKAVEANSFSQPCDSEI